MVYLMEFDIRTILLLLFLVSGLLALMLLIYWKTQKTYDGFSLWTLSVILLSFGYLLILLRGFIPDFISIIIANLLVMFSILMRVDSISRFIRSRPLPLLVYGILVPLFVLFWYFTYIEDSIPVRAALTSGIIIPCLIVVGIITIISGEEQNRYISYSFAGALFLTALIHIVRSFSWLFSAPPVTLFSTDEFNSIFFIVSLLVEILMTGFFLMLNMVRTQNDLAASEGRYRTLSDNLPDYVVVHDGRTIQYANPATLQFLGIPDNKTYGIPLESFIAPEERAASGMIIKKLQEDSGPVPPREIIIQSSDGRRHSCIIRSVRVRFHGSSAILSVLTDITERKRMEDSLRTANKKLSLLSGITRHDIRNQLMALNVYIQLSADAADNPALIREFLARELGITETIENQIGFTQDYEELGIRAPAWQHISHVIERVIPRLPLHTVQVTCEDPAWEVFADPLLEKVFYNLIDNALRYGGSRMTTIRVTNRQENGSLVIVVQDNGVGISREDKVQLFTKGFGRHTGLGLYLSREILSITGMTITENGEPGTGTRFEITVPEGGYRFTSE
jgi:PAS domain S-box-containing protein